VVEFWSCGRLCHEKSSHSEHPERERLAPEEIEQIATASWVGVRASGSRLWSRKNSA
jgi:hypothetical protein